MILNKCLGEDSKAISFLELEDLPCKYTVIMFMRILNQIQQVGILGDGMHFGEDKKPFPFPSRKGAVIQM